MYIPHKNLIELRESILSRKRHINNLADTTGEAKKLYTEFIQPIMKVYNPIISPIGNHNSNLIYRARKCKDNKLFNHIEKLYNPPLPSGRAFASENKPILYGSSSIQTSLSEIDVKIGEIVSIASFDYTNIMDGNFWFIGQLGAFYKSQEGSRYLKDEKVVQKPFYTDHDVLISLVFKDLLINEIFSAISSEKDNYELNQYLIEEISNSTPNDNQFNGVLFISTKDAPGINFAIYDNAISGLKPSIVNLVRITDIDNYGCINYELLENSSPKDGKLKWSLEIPNHD